MTGPESIYADLTSGRVSTIDQLADDVHLAMINVGNQVAHVRFAEDTPDWESPSARTEFNMRAWATRAACQVGFVRLNRTELALRRIAADYRWMDDVATDVITQYRKLKPQATDAVSLTQLRSAATVALGVVSFVYSDRLRNALDYLAQDPLSPAQEDWLRNGLARSLRYDLEDPTHLGAPIPDSLANGDDDGRFSAQGLAVDPVTGNLLQTSYNKRGEAVLSVIDPDTGAVVRTVDLGPPTGDDVPSDLRTAPDHAGGVAVHDGKVYVTSSDRPPRLFEYSMKDIDDAAPGDTVTPLRSPQAIKAGATGTIHGGVLYVATHDHDGKGSLYTYTQDDTGRWVETPDSAEGRYEVPKETQGIAVTDDYIFFTSDYGRAEDSQLIAYDRRTGLQVPPENLPNMAEGIVATKDGIVATYESGGYDYWEPNGAPPEDLWPSLNLTITPYSDFGSGDGATIDVTVETLEKAEIHFEEAEYGLDKVEGEIRILTLPASALGETAAAPEVAQAVDAHLDETSTWLAEGRISAGITAQGLIATARDYERTDDGIGGLFDNVRRYLIRRHG